MSHTTDHRPPITDHRSPAARSGFSLIEVLIASTVLVVIVIMIAMVFQQSRKSWQFGTRRAEGIVAMRTAMGFVAREISQAVDAHGITNLLGVNEVTEGLQNFNPPYKEIVFVTLGGVPGGTQRAPMLVNYKIEDNGTRIQRSVRHMVYSNGKNTWDPPAPVYSVLVAPPDRPDKSTMHISFAFEVYPPKSKELPLWVKVTATVDRSFEQRDVFANSAGPDRTFGTADDVPPLPQ